MDQQPNARLERWRDRLLAFRNRLKKIVPFVTGMVATLLALYLYNQLFPGPQPLTTEQVNDAVVSVMSSATPPPAAASLVYQVIRPSLVLIQTKGNGSDGKDQSGLGSGVVISDNGDILTSLHVVANASEIQLTFADGTQTTAQVTTEQPENDIAVLQADQLPAVLVPAVMGNPGSMNIGDDAYVVGNPFGLYSSMSAGVISGFDRSFQPENSDTRLTGLIQIDTAVNPGNSGGPLLNRYGHVVGIVEGIVNPTGQDVFIGIGFAVPITTAGGAAGSPPY
jgi:S1-C subfamily serine protease